ncbi:MAG: hypothetical protein ACI9K5_004061, partial [Gammaproteobacteria bacterium]
HGRSLHPSDPWLHPMRSLPLLLFLTACSDPAPVALFLDGEGVFPVASSDPERSRMRYLDGQVSLNNTCGYW